MATTLDIHKRTRILFCVLLLVIATQTSIAFHRQPGASITNAGWGRLVDLRGGSEDPKPEGDGIKKEKKSKTTNQDESEEGEEEQEWEDAQEEEEEEEEVEEASDAEEDADDWTEVEVMGDRVRGGQYDAQESAGEEYDIEEEEAGAEEEEPEEVVLSDLQQEDEVAADNINNVDEEDFTDALQDGFDIDMVASSTTHTDDDSSSANVDRADLESAYDEDLLVDEDDEPRTPALATGDDDNNEPPSSEPSEPVASDQGANIASEGGNEESTSVENDPGANIASEGGNEESTSVESDQGANIAPEGGNEKSNSVESDQGARIASEGGNEESTSVESVVDKPSTPPNSVVGVITDEMKKLLTDLNWKPSEIRRMKPDAAALVIANHLQRPREGIPASLCQDGQKEGGKVGKVISRVVLPIFVGAAAIYAGAELKWEDIFDGILTSSPSPASKSSTRPSKALPKPTSPPLEEPKEEVVETPAVDDESESHHTELAEASSKVDHRPHSVKPYSKPQEVDLDETWLDKGITKVGNVLKSLWTKEL